MTSPGVRSDAPLPLDGGALDGGVPADRGLRRWADELTARTGDRCAAPWSVTATRAGAVVLVRGEVVVKVHRAGTSVDELRQRLAVATGPGVAALWSPALQSEPVPVPPAVLDGARTATVWRRLDTLDPDEETQPWAEAARLLARLHSARVATALPRHGGPARLRRAVDRLESRPATPSVRAALTAAVQTLQALDALEVRGSQTHAQAARALVHGDWHLGQLGRLDGGLRLLDADDLGVGDPAWDLARPAGLWAAGLLDDASWTAFLGGYRAAGGPGVPGDGDPWSDLDLPARAAVVVAAVAALGPEGRPVDEAAEALIGACTRMPGIG